MADASASCSGSKRAAPPPSATPYVTDLSVDADGATVTLSGRGFAVVRAFLTTDELHALRLECDALAAASSASAIVRQGCVLDILAELPLRDDDAVRIDQKAYLAARSAKLATISNSPRSRLGYDAATGEDSAGEAEVVARLLFQRLPAAIARLRGDRSRPADGSPLFLFNEHYVVKPPVSEVEFRWHRDDDEQLGMCVHRDEVAPYVSAWCALDAVTLDNGPLRFFPLDDPANGLADASNNSPEPACLGPGEAKAAAFDANATAPMAAAAGDVIFFLSNVWHASSANETNTARRAFYAQFSTERITAGSNDPAPLSFAIPCTGVELDTSGRSAKRQRSSQT